MESANLLCRYSVGTLAAGLSLFFIYRGIDSLPLFFASSFLLIISITDTLYTKVPNIVNLTFFVAGLLFHFFSQGPGGFLFSLTGCLAGFALLFPAYCFRVLGAGDVKALAALGALTGASAIFQIFLYTSLFGGLIAVLYYLSKKNIPEKFKYGIGALRLYSFTRDLKILKPIPTNISFPYAAAIAFGYFVYVHYGRII